MRNLLSALLLVTTLSVLAQLDTRHYIPPMYAREDPATGTGEDIYLILSTPQTDPFEVTITDGAGTALYTNVSISRSSPVTLALSNATGASKGNGTKFLVPASDLATILSDEGMILTANKAFFVNIRVDEGAQAASLTTKGSAGLGTEFRTGHVWNNTTNNGNVFNRKAHIISFMASEDDTEVTISDFGGVDFENIDEAAQPVSGEISVMLDAGQSYVLSAHLKNSNTANTNDVNGTRITSDKPITVNSGSWLGGNPIDGNLQGRDIGIDQIASLEETGFEYILVQGQGNGNESAIVIASIDGTQIFLNGSTTPAATLDGGDFHRFSSADFTANENMHISSNQPVYVYQNTNGSVSSNERQNGLNFIPPIVCLGGTDVDIADADFTDAFGGTINSAILIIGGIKFNPFCRSLEDTEPFVF
ncbi:MAG: IgGFc-binding protein [Bacteroidota bacterium]